VKSFLKSIVSAASLLTLAAIPLAASAITIGVSDEVDTSILSGHVTQQSSSANWTNGTESSSSKSSKNGVEYDNGGASGTATDPASSTGSVTGQYNVSAVTKSNSAGTYGSYSQSSSSLDGGQEVQTGVTHTVSTFANP
jgi:hypothetical protein